MSKIKMDDILSAWGFTKSHHLACLVSGGPDSMTLLELVRRHQAQKKFKSTVLHFNFHLRGKESQRDQAFVARYCNKWHIPLIVKNTPLQPGPGIQERARNLRREISLKLAQKHQFTHLLVAHHADDQVETVLMRKQRGAGPRGLKGMDEEVFLNDRTKMIRPLLKLFRKEILQFAKQEGLGFVVDSSNTKDVYFRNRIRKQVVLLSLKEKREILKEAEKHRKIFIRDERLAQKFLNQKIIAPSPQPLPLEGGGIKGGGVPRFPINSYSSYSPNVRFLILEKILKEQGFKSQFEEKHFTLVDSLICQKKSGRLRLGCVEVRVEYGGVYVFNVRAIHELPLHIKVSPTRVPSLQKIKSDAKRGVLYISVGAGFPRPISPGPGGETPPLQIRTWHPGDKFIPLGMSQYKKLSDYFIDKKIPSLFRDKIPLVLVKGEIACVGGFAVADPFKIRGQGNCLKITRQTQGAQDWTW